MLGPKTKPNSPYSGCTADTEKGSQAIPFTQYRRPHGRMRLEHIFRPQEVFDKAMKIIEAGYRFEIEMLSTNNLISATIHDPLEGTDIVIADIVPNGPKVLEAIDRMIMEFEIP